MEESLYKYLTINVRPTIYGKSCTGMYPFSAISTLSRSQCQKPVASEMQQVYCCVA